MNGNTKRSSDKRVLRIVLILLVVAVMAVGIGVLAKYVSEAKAFSAKLHVTAKLFQTMEIWEHEIVEDGDTYTLGEDLVTGNAYKLHPGIEVPKDPAVYIKGKTSLKGYLYVEVVDGVSQRSDNAIQYELADHWLDTSLTGPNGGKVYVYVNGGEPVEVTNDPNADFSVQILKDDKVSVAEDWEPAAAIDSGLELTFYAYMVQVQEGVNYQAAFTAAFMDAAQGD